MLSLNLQTILQGVVTALLIAIILGAYSFVTDMRHFQTETGSRLTHIERALGIPDHHVADEVRR